MQGNESAHKSASTSKILLRIGFSKVYAVSAMGVANVCSALVANPGRNIPSILLADKLRQEEHDALRADNRWAMEDEAENYD